MKSIGSICVLALALNLLFFFCSYKEYHAISMAHGNVAFNLYRYTNPGINTQLAEHMYAMQNGAQELIDFNVVRDIDFGPPDAPFPVNDTIGYGVLLGLLWKVTHSLSFTDVMVVQIFIYLLMVFLIYQIGLLLFSCTQTALYCAIAFVSYLPLIALNVHAVRDVWAAYGSIMLLYALLAYMSNKKSLLFFMGACICFACCQWIRPSLFLGLIAATGVLFVYMCTELRAKRRAKKIIITIAMLWVANIVCFWIPFMHYNKVNYGRYFVSPAGQDLLEGLGEFANPWGYQLSDEYVANLIQSKSGYTYGTPQFDDAAKQEFMRAYVDYPTLFWMNIFRRLPMLVLPSLPWLFYTQSPYASYETAQEKIKALLISPPLWIDFVVRHLYMRVYILFGWIGLLVLVWQKRYGVALIILAVLFASVAKLPSHIEYRYLTPYYWIFCISIGFVVDQMRVGKKKSRGIHGSF